MAAYNASDVSLSMRIHTKDCASHKSTFTHWVDIEEADMPEWDYIDSEVLYGDLLLSFYNEEKLVGKRLTQQDITTFSKYVKDGVGEGYECDCGRPYTKIEGFAKDELITIKRED